MSTTTERSYWEWDVTYMAIYAVLALLYFLPALLPGAHVFGTDYLAAAYFKNEMTSAQMAAGILPAWLPHVYGGVPLFANPASTFQPVKVLADLVLPVSKLFAASLVVHFSLAGIGAYLLARELEARRWVAFVAGLAFQFTGLTMSYVYAGHDGRIIVAALAPLFLFFLHRGVRKGTLPSFAGAAATLGFALLSFQIQSSYYLLLAGGLWAAFALARFGHFRQPGPLAKRVVLGFGAVAFAFALASVNFLPFLDYIDASPRGGEEGRGYEYSVSWSMPPAELAGLAVPEYTGVSVSDPVSGEALFPSYEGDNPFKLHSEYVGAVVLLLFLLGLYYNRKDRYWWFFLLLGGFALSLSFGGHTPIYRVYYELLPGTDKFRAPSIAFFLVSVSLVAMAALTLERLATLRPSPDDERSPAGGDDPLSPALWTMGGAVGLLLVATGLASASGVAPERVAGLFRFTLFAGLTAAALWLWLRGRITGRVAMVALAVITVVDLGIIDRRFFHTVPSPDQMFARDEVASYLVTQPGPFRVWSLPVPAGRTYRQDNYLMRFDIEQAGGEHGNQLQRYNEYVGAGETTYVDWHNFLQHPQFLDAANVRYVIAGVELNTPLFREVHRGRRAVIYENPDALPRAYLVPRVQVAEPPAGALEAMKAPGFDPRETAVVYESPDTDLPSGPLDGEAEVVERTANRVVVRARANRPAFLVLADNHYDGWRAEIDGEEVPVLLANHTFRGVTVGAGTSEVVFRFRPGKLLVGFWLYVIGFVLLAGYGVVLVLRYGRGEPAPSE